MARYKPTLTFAGSLEVETQEPLDARTVVPTKADLTVAGNFPYAYKGLLVYAEDEEKYYALTDIDVTDINNWKEVGSGEGNTVSVELTQAEYDALTDDEKNNGTVYFITDGQGGGGSSTIGRWEKIAELQGSELPTTHTVDFSKYNAITITSIAPFGEVNECFTTVEDFAVGRRLTTSYFDLNPDQNRTVTIERTGEDTISISNANGMGICIYGYKETGLSNADVKRVANEVGNVVSVPSGGTTGQVLTKKTDADGDTEWKDGGSALPTGGTTGQLLAKKSNTVGDVEWINNSSDLSNANAGVRIGTYHDGRAIYQRSIIFNSMTFTQEGSIWVCKDVPIIARNMRVDIIDVDFIIQKPLAASPDYIQFQTPVPSTCWTYEVDGSASTRQELGVTYQEYGKPIGGGGYVFAVWAHVSASSNYFNGSSAVVTVKYMQR